MYSECVTFSDKIEFQFDKIDSDKFFSEISKTELSTKEMSLSINYIDKKVEIYSDSFTDTEKEILQNCFNSAIQ
jgi:hypothetical protein